MLVGKVEQDAAYFCSCWVVGRSHRFRKRGRILGVGKCGARVRGSIEWHRRKRDTGIQVSVVESQ